MPGAPLIITQTMTASLRQLREDAAGKPVDMHKLSKKLATPKGKVAHANQMTAQSIIIPGPWPFVVTFSVESGHPCGLVRHMSMSLRREGRVPNAQAVWMVAEILGFSGGMNACRWWVEDLEGHGLAVNVVQPVPS